MRSLVNKSKSTSDSKTAVGRLFVLESKYPPAKPGALRF